MRRTLFLLLLALLPAALDAQATGYPALHADVRGLGATARVLMIGAHPDDEDTQLIAWLARGRRVETAYLSLTRGDGGQNLIGNELGEALGVVRTGELLAARRVDGGRQYFTRAFDFGFSKSAEETFTHWPKDTLLRDVVTIVRAFRPHVIVSVFSGTPRDGHGHHQVAGILAREAYEAAGDSVRFPAEAVGGLAPWAPLTLYRGVFRFGGVNPDTIATLRVNVGEYDPVLGRSYAEIAGESRSQHLSQGFGSLQPKGVRWSWLRREASRVAAPADAKAERSLLDGIDTTWARVGLPALDTLARRAMAVLDPRDVGAAVPAIAAFVRELQGAARGCAATAPHCGDLAATVEAVEPRATRALLEAAGVSLEVVAPRALVALGDSLPLVLEVYNRGRAGVALDSVAIHSRSGANARFLTRGTPVRATVLPDSVARLPLRLDALALTTPWWRRRGLGGDLFRLEEAGMLRLPATVVNGADTTVRVVPRFQPAAELVMGEDRVRDARVDAWLVVDGTPVRADAGPIVHRYADPARGEIRRPVAVVPAISVLLERGVEYMPAGKPVVRRVRVHLTSALTAPWRGRVELRLPDGLRADAATRPVTVPAGGEADVFFTVQGRVPAGLLRMSALAHQDSTGRTAVSFDQGYVPIDYPHLVTQRFYRPALTYLSVVDVHVPDGTRVAYVPGVGDNVPGMLRQLGVPVAMVDPDTLATTDLSRYSTLVVGPRAYDASTALRASAPRVLDFARRGGTVVLQYGQYEMLEPGVLPYPITLGRPADRVTEEDAAVRVLDAAHRLLRAPNRIADQDWKDWVQERGLYMPRTFDARWTPLVATHDEGEPENRGGVLVAPLGRGTVVYTTLSFFRQLPGGIPGPARIFVNLLAAGMGESPRTP